MTPRDETTVREFLAPLRTLPPVTRRPEHTEQSRRREIAELVGVALAAFALVGLIAFIAHGHRQAPPRKVVQKPPNQFAHIGGWIAIASNPIAALDPAHPQRTATLAPFFGFPLSWSRNRRELLVLRGVGKSGGLDVVRGDGTITKVAHGDTQGGSLTPDGNTVIYSSGGRIFEVSARGGTPKVLVHNAPKTVNLFSYFTGQQLSPDGSAIDFMGWRRDASGESGIWVANRDGTGAHLVLSTPRATAFSGGPRYQNQLSELAWFPDSRRLLVILLDQSTDHCDVLAVNRDGSNLRRWGPPGRFCPMRAAVEPGGHQFAFTGIQRDHIAITDLSGRLIRYANIPRRVRGNEMTVAWAPR
jgi:hypothetical protein